MRNLSWIETLLLCAFVFIVILYFSPKLPVPVHASAPSRFEVLRTERVHVPDDAGVQDYLVISMHDKESGAELVCVTRWEETNCVATGRNWTK
jgi:hypothetical protein